MNGSRMISAVVLILVAVAWLSCQSNHRPDIPAVPSGPDCCLKDSTYTFTTVASDPDGDSMAFRFDWGDSTVSHWEGWFAGGETVAFSHAWKDTGTYEVRAWAQDARLLNSELSEGLTVRVVVRLPPNTPTTPTGPSVGGKDTLYDFKAGAGHPDWLQVAIRFSWGDGDTSDWSGFVLPNGPVEMSHSWSTPDTYLITAQARDTFGLTSPWSEPHTIVIRPSGWSELRMVGQPVLPPDSSGFLIRVINDGTVEGTVSWLAFYDTPESAYMRDCIIERNHGIGYPVPNGQNGTGRGDTVRFAPVTIAPYGTQLAELYFAEFYVDEVIPPGSKANVHGKQFVFRFSDGSEITVNP